MYHSFHNRFNLNNVTIHPGEYKVSDEDIIISTVLGSCISVALFDPKKKQGGMNHFLLPKDGIANLTEKTIIKQEYRYGLYAMEILINSLLKMGSQKKNLVAKVFGGSEMFEMTVRVSNVGKQNREFALLFLKNEEIPVVASDLGGKLGRKVLYFPQTGRILLKKLNSVRRIKSIEEGEKEYKDSLKPKQDDGETTIVLF